MKNLVEVTAEKSINLVRNNKDVAKAFGVSFTVSFIGGVLVGIARAVVDADNKK